jgi:hypothetical protein
MNPVTSGNPADPSPAAPTVEAAHEPAADAAEELDVWWGSYAGRAMVPGFVGCGLLTLAIACGTWYWCDVYAAHPRVARYTAYTLGTLVWGIQLLRWAYRTVFTNYRLTTRRLYRDQGFHQPAGPAVELAAVTAVTVEPPTFWERLLDVGRVRVVCGNGPVHELVLDGVYRPRQVAEQMHRQVQRAQRK